jgi:dTDP-glucose 4,6-dehydratase
VHLFVTGGTGFIGKALLRHWVDRPEALAGWRFTLLSRHPELFRQTFGDLLAGLDVQLHRGDIMHPASLPDDASITHVLHGATDSTIGPSLPPLVRFDQIVQGTRNVLETARRLGVKRLLLISSGGAYGPPSPGMESIPETWNGMPDPLEPQNAYSLAKRQAEHLCALYHEAYGVESVIARGFAFVGEDLPVDAHFAIGNFLRDALRGDTVTVQGDGTPIRSYMDQRDLARWLTVMLLKGQAQRAYNVGSDHAVSIADVAHIIARHGAHPALPVNVLRAAPMGQAARRNCYVPDLSRARTELGLDVEFGLEAAIEHTLARLRARSTGYRGRERRRPARAPAGLD